MRPSFSEAGAWSEQGITRTGGSLSFSASCPKAGGSCWITRRNNLRITITSQLREQFLVDSVEPAVAENRHDIVRPKQRHDPFHDRFGVWLVESRSSGGTQCFHYCFGMQTLVDWDLFERGYLRNKNAVRELKRFRQLF